MNIFGRWEETEVSGENLPRYERNVPSPHRRWPWLGIDFLSHQILNKMTWNEITLFKDLLQFQEVQMVTGVLALATRQ